MKKIWGWVISILGTGEKKKSHLTSVVSSHHEAEQVFPGGFVAGGIWANFPSAWQGGLPVSAWFSWGFFLRFYFY